MAATPKEKFEAAVKVIQSLPKNGSFQPSHALMLKFYGYYKQATEGPCTKPKPSFWDVVGKAKWDAWNKLENLPQEKAMQNYVEELKKVLHEHFGSDISQKDKIIEAMPHTEMVAEFVDKLGVFYEIVEEEPPVPINGNLVSVMKKNSPSKKSDTSESLGESDTLSSDLEDSPPRRSVSPKDVPLEVIPNPLVAAKVNGEQKMPNGHCATNGHHSKDTNGTSPHYSDSDESDIEEFCDTSDLPQQLIGNNLSYEVSSPYIPVKAVGHAGKGDGFRPRDSSPDHDSGVSEHGNIPHFPDTDYPSLDSVSARGGGGQTQQSSQSGAIRRTGSNTSMASQQSRGNPPLSGNGSRRQHYPSVGGASGGERPPHQPSKAELSEQIAVSLVRLQQDMNSVLSRLNALETLTLAQHQITRSRQNSESQRNIPWWWPFEGVSGKTLFLILAWPLVVNWILKVIAKRRNRIRRL